MGSNKLAKSLDSFREIQWAEAFVRLYNAENKTDFSVKKIPRENDSADVCLTAPGIPDQEVQIVRMTNPQSMQARTGIIRFHRRLRQKVVSIVPERLDVNVDMLRDIHPKEVEGIVEKIGDELKKLNDYPFKAPLTLHVNSSAIRSLSLESIDLRWQSDVHVLTPHKQYDLLKLVEETVEKKRKKNYSDQSKLWLLIVEGDVPYSPKDFERIGKIGAAKRGEDFSRIFYVSPVAPMAFYRELL